MTTTTIHDRYKEAKAEYPDALILMRCGDFYETYEDDAESCSKVLGITLTKRTKDGLRMAGFPHFNLDTYLPKFIRAGRGVIITE